ncbi:DUF6232 family protein [Micromonospora sp. CPCC 206061]|uniref:DUF6232 family protein n=1 Tax=Micromonospora sp. CPCC 206061 TaxID=3122410 RepID=UPI002FEEB5B8
MTIDRLNRPTRPARTTFYNQRGVIVDDQCLLVYGARFPIADLFCIERARGPLSPPTRAAMVVALGELLVVTPVAIFFRSPVVIALALLIGLAAAGGVLFCGRRWPASFQLWAEYQHRPTLVFATWDEQEFGQVSRALLRAIEHQQRY